MELSEIQIEFIRKDILQSGITMEELSDSLLDHICCCVERSNAPSFEKAYEQTIKDFGKRGLINVQEETILLINLKKEEVMKKTMFILGYIAVILITSGMLFKMMRWHGANIMLVLGIALLNFGYLPLYFKDRYRKAVN